MLLSTEALVYYGPACAAMVVEDAQGTLHQAVPHQTQAAGMVAQGVGSAPVLRPFRGRICGVTGEGQGTLHHAGARQRVRAALTVQIGVMSQDDVTGAVLESPVEGGLTVRQALRLLVAVAAGKSRITDHGDGTAQVAFRDQADTKDRIVAAMTGSERTSVAKDPT